LSPTGFPSRRLFISRAGRVSIGAMGEPESEAGRATGSALARPAWIGVGLVLLAVLVYAPVRGHAFVSWDDQTYVCSNPHVAGGPTAANIRWAFTTGYAGNWHPLTWISHMLDVSLFGMDAGAHHVTNLVLHVANTLLLFGVLRRATGALGRSAFVAALFAVHPLHVESVAWVAERKDVLSTLFLLLTLEAYVAWVRAPSPKRYALVLLAFAAGLMSKPMIVTLPFALLLLDAWPLRRMTDAAAARRLVVEKIPLFVLAAASCVVTFVAQRGWGAVGGLEKYPLGGRVANALVAYVAYVVKTLKPTGLSALYPYDPALPIWRAALAGAALVGVTLLAVRQRRARPWFLVGWLWFLGTLVPVIGLVQVGMQSMADRYTYVPLVGLFVVIAWGATDLVGWERRRGAALPAAAVAATLACAVLASRQVETWKDSEALWRHAVNVDPDSAVARNDLGTALCDQGRYDDAIVEFREFLRIRPDDADAHNNIGHALSMQGRHDEAVAEFRAAIAARPDFARAYGNLGLALRTLGRRDEALAALREASRLEPDYPVAHHNLAIALAESGRLDEAVAEISETLRLTPDDGPSHADFGLILERRGDRAGAVREFETALRLDPDNDSARAGMARLTGRGGR
jgi:Flp pilus assembly protein TadD